MTEAQISEALCRRLVEALTDYTVVQENRDSLPAPPYLVTEIVRVSKTDATLTGVKPVHRGYLQVSVISETDVFNDQGLRIAEEAAAVYPYPLRIAAGDGEIVITKPPQVEQAFRDGPDWRTPVRVDYEATA
jgi:hypothetical protein